MNKYDGDLLDDGRIPVNESITWSCSNVVEIRSICAMVDQSNSSHGEWRPKLECNEKS